MSYGRYKQNGQIDIIISPEDKDNTLNDIKSGHVSLYFPKRFHRPVITDYSVSYDKRQAFADQFYENFGRDRIKTTNFQATADDILKGGHFLDNPDDNVMGLLGIAYSWLCQIDDPYEDFVVGFDEQYTEFAVGIYKNSYACLANPDNSPPFPTNYKVPATLIERGRLIRDITVAVVHSAKQTLLPNHFRAWIRAHMFYFHHYINRENYVRRLTYYEKRPIDLWQYLETRSVTVGKITMSPYYVDPQWDLDNEFQPDSYIYRLSGRHMVLINDLLSLARDYDQENFNIVKVLKALGRTPEAALVESANEKNNTMRLLERCYGHLPTIRNYVYAEMRASYHITATQLKQRRYGWKYVGPEPSTE